MVRITVNDDLVSELAKTADFVELCDPSGRVLGVFTPKLREGSGRLRELSPYTNEQLDEISKQPGGRPLADILHDLENR